MHDTVVRDAAPATPLKRHQPWCDLRQHALARAEATGPSGCVGRYVQHGAAGGWVTDDAPEQGTGSRFVVDFRPAEGWASLRPEEAAELCGLLARLLGEYERPTPRRRLFSWGRRPPG